MSDPLNKKLINTMQSHLPQGIGLAAMLMETLSLSKESVYRRLRGDVLFSLGEASKISQHLGFSLDDIASDIASKNRDPDKVKWAVANIETISSLGDHVKPSEKNYVKQYTKNVLFFTKIFKEMQNREGAILRCATNSFPARFMMLYKKLILFRYYRWVYLTQGVNPNFHFSDLVMPEDFLKVEKEGIETYSNISEMTFILDRNIFTTTINDINYFFNRKLISKAELHELKSELLDLASYMEEITATGKNPNNNEKINIFLSDVTLDTTLVHIEYESVQYAFYWLYYYIDYISFTNPKICQKQKNWIELLKRYSTLISQTGEVQRFEFFKEQQEMIETKLSI